MQTPSFLAKIATMALKSKTYTVAWDEVLDNVLDVGNQLKAANLDYLVFDVTSSPVERDGWVVADKVRYFGHFYNSLRDFVASEADIFIFDAGDIYGDCHAELTKSVAAAMEKDLDIWIMSPNITNESGHNRDTDAVPYTALGMSKTYSNYVLSMHVNGLWTALSRELAECVLGYYEWALKNGKMDFKTMISGHGLDYVYCAWALYNNKKIYRDLGFRTTTGVATSFDTSGARYDFLTVIRSFIDYIGEQGGDALILKQICQNIQNRSVLKKMDYPLEYAYLNMTNIKEFTY